MGPAPRRSALDALLQVSELALQGVDLRALVETALDHALRTFRSEATVIVLRDEHGRLRTSLRGARARIEELQGLLPSFARQLLQAGPNTVLTSAAVAPRFAALAAVIPGTPNPAGMFCLGRAAEAGPFQLDETELLLGYARTVALAVQRLSSPGRFQTDFLDTISAFVTAMESKDVYLKGHSARVSLYAGEIATAMGLPATGVMTACRAGILHDLGKLVIPDSILHNPGRLSAEEYRIIKRHPIVAGDILKALPFLACEAGAVRHHHERYDGTGYPDGLRGDDIPLVARIVTVADAFDAMTSNRPYRRASSLEVGLAEIARATASQFDPVVARAFASIPRSRLVEISRFQETPARAVSHASPSSAPTVLPAPSERLELAGYARRVA